MREHLEQYCQALQEQRDEEGNKLIDFPTNFDEVVSVMIDEARQAPPGLMNARWQRYLDMEDGFADGKAHEGKSEKDLDRQKKILHGLRRIQMLDDKLATKSKEAAEMRREREMQDQLHDEEACSSVKERQLAEVEQSVKQELKCDNWIGQKQHKLSEDEELRVEEILNGIIDGAGGEDSEVSLVPQYGCCSSATIWLLRMADWVCLVSQSSICLPQCSCQNECISRVDINLPILFGSCKMLDLTRGSLMVIQ